MTAKDKPPIKPAFLTNSDVATILARLERVERALELLYYRDPGAEAEIASIRFFRYETSAINRPSFPDAVDTLESQLNLLDEMRNREER